MVGFVEDDQVPAGSLEQTLDAGPTLERVDAGDEPVVFGEGIRLAIRDVALTAENLEAELENVVDFPVPVVHEAGGHHHQRALQLATAREFAQEQRRLDGLAESDLVGHQKTPRRGGRDAMREDHLMRQQVDGDCRQRRGAVDERERVGLTSQPGTPQAFRAAFHARQHALVPRGERLDRAYGNLSFAVREDGAQISLVHRLDDDAFAEIGVSDTLPRLEVGRHREACSLTADPSRAAARGAARTRPRRG